MINAPIIEKVRSYIQNHDQGENEWLALLEYRTWVWRKILQNLYEWKIEKYRISTLDTLYTFFKIERDEFYTENMLKIKRRHESIFWQIMFEMRRRKGLKIDEVSMATKIDERTIRRIEYGEVLPNFSSYTLTKLLDLYDFPDEDRNTIGWMITISKDTQKILKRITAMP